MEKMIMAKGTITSLEILKQINIFREQEGRSELKHYDLLKVIREEFDEEIREGKISFSQYDHKMPTGGIKKQPMFELTFNQAKQILVRESKTVRKAVIHYIEKLENELKNPVRTEEERLVLSIYNGGIDAVEGAKKLVELKTKPLQNKINLLTHVNKLYTSTEIGKELGFKSAREFNKVLEEKKIQFKVNGTWVFTAKYSNMGYESIKQNVLDNGRVIYDRKFTQEGRDFLIKLFRGDING